MMDLPKAAAVTVIKTGKCPTSLSPFSKAVRVGNILYTAGQVGNGLDRKLVGDDVESQTEQALLNLKTILESGGASLNSTFKTTVFLTVSGWS